MEQHAQQRARSESQQQHPRQPQQQQRVSGSFPQLNKDPQECQDGGLIAEPLTELYPVVSGVQWSAFSA